MLACTRANAAVVSFSGEADNNGERGELGDGSYSLQNVYTGGLNISLLSSEFPYFDRGLAGLGVCQKLPATRQCDPGSDDNVTAGEWVGLMFDFAVDISGLIFRNADHVDISSSLDTLLIGINGGATSSTTFLDASSGSLLGVTLIRCEYGGGVA